MVKDLTTSRDENGEEHVNLAANVMAHALLGGVLAGLSDKDVTADAVGAGSAPLIGRAIAKTMYGSDDPEKLSDEQKNELSQLTSVAGGLLGMVTSKGGAVDAATAAVAAKNEVENNYLRADQALAFDKEMSACHKSGKDCSSIIGRYRKISNRQSAALKKKLSTEPLVVQSIDKELVQGGYDVTDAPAWANDIFGLDAMRDEQAKAFVRSWNSQDLASIDKNSPTWSKFAAFASEPENMFALASTGFAIKDLVPTATSLIRRDLVSGTVDAAKIGMQWGKGVAKQGGPWENYFEDILPKGSRLPPNFKTFDYYVPTTKTAISVKSMDTQTLAKISNPKQVYNAIKGYVDRTVKFKTFMLSDVRLSSSMIANREIDLAIPRSTTQAQWVELNRAVEYGKMQGVKIKITEIK